MIDSNAYSSVSICGNELNSEFWMYLVSTKGGSVSAYNYVVSNKKIFTEEFCYTLESTSRKIRNTAVAFLKMPEIDAGVGCGVGLDCDVYGFGFSLVDKYDIIHAHISAIDGICISPYEECSLSVSVLGIDFPVVSLFSEQDLN